MNTLVGFPSELDVSRKLRVEVRKRETFSRGMWGKKAPFCPTLREHHSAEWKMTERRKHAVFLNGEGQSHYCRTPTITSLLFSLPWIRYEHVSDGLEGRPALDPALLLLCLNYSFPAPKQLRCEKQTCEILTRTGFIINFDCISHQLTAGNIAQHLHTTSLIIHGIAAFDSILLNERNAVIMFNFTALIASRAAWLQPRQEYNIQLGFLQCCGVETTGPCWTRSYRG